MMNQKITYIICLFALVTGLLAGCGGSSEDSDGTIYFHSSMASSTQEDDNSTQEATETQTQELYMIVEINQIEESLRLYRYANGMEYRYYYGTGTRFHDKYGNRTTVMSFTVGSVITLGEVDSEGLLREAQISDEVWVYDDISRFSIEEERHIFEIAGSRYSYDDETTYVFSNDERVTMEDIAQGDTLSVVGMGKEILSVCITTGQGILQLENTELFEGSYLQLGGKVFAEITENMELSVEEGTYELIVANDGWGGSTEITIVRGETVTVDLDELKGDGPKLGNIRFIIDVADALLLIDGEEVDYSSPIELSYGKHSLAVYANGYDGWVRNLYVNSSEATIVIQLNDDDEDEDEEEETVTTTEEESESESESDSTDLDAALEELELVQDLLTSLVL